MMMDDGIADFEMQNLLQRPRIERQNLITESQFKQKFRCSNKSLVVFYVILTLALIGSAATTVLLWNQPAMQPDHEQPVWMFYLVKIWPSFMILLFTVVMIWIQCKIDVLARQVYNPPERGRLISFFFGILPQILFVADLLSYGLFCSFIAQHIINPGFFYMIGVASVPIGWLFIVILKMCDLPGNFYRIYYEEGQNERHIE